MNDPLRDTLVDLALLLKPDGIELIIGGGYGLLLRHEAIATHERFSRFGLNTIARSTNDLDCFLGVEVISDSGKTERIATALKTLGFQSIQNHWQFGKHIGSKNEVTIDLLSPVVPEALAGNMHQRNDPRRQRPKGFDKLHGRRTPEAVTIERLATRVDASRDGREAFVRIPHPLSFVLMKLFAFRDRIGKADNDYGAYHAFDVLQTIDSMNRMEWDEARELMQEPEAAATVGEAREIIANLFSSQFAEGTTRLVQYAREKQSVPITAAQASLFVADLGGLFSR